MFLFPDVSLKLLFLFFLLTSVTLSSPTPTHCPTTNGEPPPLVQLVTATPSSSPPLTYALLVVNCTSEYPTHWTFSHHPSSSNVPHFAWNVSHVRVKRDVLDDSPGAETFLSVLAFQNVTRDELRDSFGAECAPVGGGVGCAGVALPEIVLKGSGDSYNNVTRNQTLENGGVGTRRKNCSSVDLWFDEDGGSGSGGHFLCRNRSPPTNESPLLPTMSFRYCSNPTECGVSTSEDPENSADCWEHPTRSTNKNARSCHPGVNPCSSLGVGSEFPIPKVISCSSSPLVGNNGDDDKLGVVKLLGYFHSLKEINGRPASSYVNWDEADPSDLVTLTTSKIHLMENESLEVECSASAYYFAGGLHLTLKGVSGRPSYSENELSTSMASATLEETLELWRNQIPVQRTLLASNVILPPGEYEVTCYAPVWNSTAWTEKRVLVSVANVTYPNIVTGNGTTSMEFAPRRNFSCLAKGVPPPKISWTYREDRVKVVEVHGEGRQMSWSHITLPESMDPSNTDHTLEFKCRAENAAGFSEKMFIVTRNDESFLVSTKIAGFVVLLGFVANLIVFFICWKKLFHESEEEEDEERKELAGIKFLRALWAGQVCWRRWCHCPGYKDSPPAATPPGTPPSANDCPHPKCRQKQTA